ncbi:putative endolysin [uncultured Caudovirales phage]|uniref:Putative endolysin n=1 Tax=uncultured Caudovirales phage TaxID=2100421 RepID=A0A2H4J8A3_9CAUD|nr:putative endolysin [uncultured Caudovirales phage]
MLANLNAGHTLTGADIGTRGINGSKEEVLTRQLVKELEKEFKAKGHKTNSVVVDHAATLDESLNKQVILCNRVNANINIVIHFNSVPSHEGYGTEIYTYKGKYLAEADRVLKNMNKLGFRNRGIKQQDLALINRTVAETLYIEVCFIDNPTDVAILNKYGLNTIAKAIVCGVLGIEFNVNNTTNSNNNPNSLDGKLGVVTAKDGLNVREGKSTSSKILGVLKHGEKVRLYRKDGEWISIYYPKHGGYVYADYIDIL